MALAADDLLPVFAPTYAVQPAYGIGFPASVFLWVPVPRQPLLRNTDPPRRQPLVAAPVVVGVVSSGILSFGYLYAISIHSIGLSLVFSVLMWGIAYQGFDGVFPSLFPELFRTRVRVTGMAIGQNVGTTFVCLAAVAFRSGQRASGSTNIPLKIGFLTFGIVWLLRFAAFTTQETYRIRLDDLGDRNTLLYLPV